jgi:hypothetical protein
MATFNDIADGKTGNNNPTERKDSRYSWLWVAGILLTVTVLAAAIAWYYFTFRFKPEGTAGPRSSHLDPVIQLRCYRLPIQPGSTTPIPPAELQS